MRINQLQNLCWLGNVVVFLGLGYAGYVFYGAWQQRKTPPPAVEWPESEAPEVVPLWPPSIGKFKHVWDTYVNGVIPPPPPPPVETSKPQDDSAKFKGSVTFAGGLENFGTPMNSTVIVVYSGNEVVLKIGSMLDGWRLVAFSRDDERHVDRLHFYKGGKVDKTVVIEGPPLDQTLDPKLATEIKLEPGDPDVPRGAIPTGEQGHRGIAADTWQIPHGEVEWYEKWGKEDYLPTLDLRPNTLPDGTVQGIKVAGDPGKSKVLTGPRGVVQGDVILSINGVKVSAQEDVVLYLENEGAGLAKYTVKLIRRGKEVTQVYLVGRPNPGRLVSRGRRGQRPK